MSPCRITVPIPASPRDRVHAVELAIERLREARILLVAAGARRSAQRVRLALKSADGARRHAWGLESRVKHGDYGRQRRQPAPFAAPPRRPDRI